jgi:hypothetical protein
VDVVQANEPTHYTINHLELFRILPINRLKIRIIQFEMNAFYMYPYLRIAVRDHHRNKLTRSRNIYEKGKRERR